MKLGKKRMLVVSFMLFSLFFGAGNLIFPPFMGQNAAGHSVGAAIGFLGTAVVLPVLGVIVVAEFNGLDRLGQRVGKKFAIVFTVLIYLSIGPGLGIPRAASVPFEMAVAPYLPQSVNLRLGMLLYSLVFFMIALWLALNPGKLVDRIGRVLTPLTLLSLCTLFVGFLFKGKVDVAQPQTAYQKVAFLQGFTDGYQTMDTIAALNFGLVIANTLHAYGVKDKKSVIRNTVAAGLFAGTILASVYIVLTYMGAASSGVYPGCENGAVILRSIVHQVYGEGGAILLATLFTLACLTTCVGLINSISRYFSGLFPKVPYKTWACGIVAFSFLVCNMGLNAILSVSIPVLNAIYPVSIVLIALGLTDRFWKKNRFVYPMVVAGTGLVSVLFAMDSAKVPMGFVSRLLRNLPLYEAGFGWVIVAAAMFLLSLLLGACLKKQEVPAT